MSDGPRQRTAVDAALDVLLQDGCPGDADEAAVQAFLERQFDLGLAWVHFPEGCGGLGVPSDQQRRVDERLTAAGAPIAFHRNPLGVGMIAPTLVRHGNPTQQQRLLRPLFSGEEIWCQLFSEPGAGSDLASVATSAKEERPGTWTVRGEKVWTSFAHLARWGLLLARTDPALPKHRGLTAFVVDMTAAGVGIRPLFQMTGDAEFNEVLLGDVELPDDQRLGHVGEGWRVVLTTLLNERVAIGGRVPQRGEGVIGHALRQWSTCARRDPARRDELVRLWLRAEVLRLFNGRAAARRDDEQGPGSEGWISKILSAELNQDATRWMVDLAGPEAMVKPGGYPLARAQRSPFEFAGVQHEYLRALANSIEGGTSEVARTVIAERVLGLPAEPRNDKHAPWNTVPRG